MKFIKKTKVHKTPIPLKTKAFVLKSKVILVISLCSEIEKTEKTPLPNQMEICFSRTLQIIE
jgi:hypothetical protein